jgi:hypothetical protein
LKQKNSFQKPMDPAIYSLMVLVVITPKGTTSKEYLFPEDLEKTTEGLTTFYDLDPQGIGFVFT